MGYVDEHCLWVGRLVDQPLAKTPGCEHRCFRMGDVEDGGQMKAEMWGNIQVAAPTGSELEKNKS